MKRPDIFFSSIFLALLMTASPCLAAPYDLKNMTPEIDQALKARQARYTELQGLKQAGAIGENNRGYVTSLKGDPGAASIVAAENADRGVIYRALVEQNALGPNGMMEVERAFAEVQNEKAAAGEMIQSLSGDWVKKTA